MRTHYELGRVVVTARQLTGSNTITARLQRQGSFGDSKDVWNVQCYIDGNSAGSTDFEVPYGTSAPTAKSLDWVKKAVAQKLRVKTGDLRFATSFNWR